MAEILLVEDDAEVSALLLETLVWARHDVAVARNAEEALPLVRERHFDVLLTDVVMPGSMSGFELAAAARRLRPTIKTICCSGFSAVQAKPGVCDVFFDKPFKLDAIVAAVEELLSR